jgi:hypothetical protein
MGLAGAVTSRVDCLCLVTARMNLLPAADVLDLSVTSHR